MIAFCASATWSATARTRTPPWSERANWRIPSSAATTTRSAPASRTPRTLTRSLGQAPSGRATRSRRTTPPSSAACAQAPSYWTGSRSCTAPRRTKTNTSSAPIRPFRLSKPSPSRPSFSVTPIIKAASCSRGTVTFNRSGIPYYGRAQGRLRTTSEGLCCRNLEAQVLHRDSRRRLVPVRRHVVKRDAEGALLTRLKRRRARRDRMRRLPQYHLVEHIHKFQLKVQPPDRFRPLVSDLRVQ